MRTDRKKRRGKGLNTLILVVSLCVFLYSGYRLFQILRTYAAAKSEYSGLQDDFTKPNAAPTPTEALTAQAQEAAEAAEPDKEETPAPTATPPPTEPYIDEAGNVVYPAEGEAVPPLAVDWDQLAAINSDIVGWIYVDALPSISYPILQTGDNDYYLHHTFRREALFAGSIFMDYYNKRDFSDPNTIVYGHNMRNGSMFGRLSDLENPKVCGADPYFWILTPEADYRYEIYSVMETPVESDVYSFFAENGTEAFLDWEKQMKAGSCVEREVPLSNLDLTVTLSTCTGDSTTRCVVMGRRVWVVRHSGGAR